MRHRTTAIVLALTMTVLVAGTARAARPTIPAALYPAGASITFHPHLSNHQLDCLWSFFCEGHLALFHTQTQDQLGRIGGWAEFGGADLDGGRMTFEVFSSTYAPDDSRRAYSDLIVAVENQGYSPVPRLSAQLSMNGGESIAELQPNGSFDLVVMAAWTGNREIEGLADFVHTARARHDALRCLRRQMRVAVHAVVLGSDHGPAFQTLVTNRPAPYDWDLYESWVRAHHRSVIPMTRFSWPWMAHRRMCGGAVSGEIFNPRTLSTIQDFDRCWADWNPLTGKMSFRRYASLPRSAATIRGRVVAYPLASSDLPVGRGGGPVGGTEPTTGSPLVPAMFYPAHTRLSSLVPLSNAAMDCGWAFVCRHNRPLTEHPLFHFTDEDALHRISGWAQFGRLGKHGPKLRFALYGSRYFDGRDPEGLPWSLRAFVDFRLTNLAHGFAEFNHDPVLVPRGVLGNSGGQIMRGPTRDILAVSCWAGTIEVEAVALYVHGDRAARKTALRDLTGQVEAAVGILDSRR